MKELLDKFLVRHVISQEQYDKSLGELMRNTASVLQQSFES